MIYWPKLVYSVNCMFSVTTISYAYCSEKLIALTRSELNGGLFTVSWYTTNGIFTPTVGWPSSNVLYLSTRHVLCAFCIATSTVFWIYVLLSVWVRYGTNAEFIFPSTVVLKSYAINELSIRVYTYYSSTLPPPEEPITLDSWSVADWPRLFVPRFMFINPFIWYVKK